MTVLVARHVDLVALFTAARCWASDRPWDPAAAVGATTGGCATVAMGKAFSFGYPKHAVLLWAAGTEVVEFNPFGDPLPDSMVAVLLPGGFPE